VQEAVQNAEEDLSATRSASETTVRERNHLKNASMLDLHARKADIPVLKEAANRWTDNVFESRKRIMDMTGIDGKEIDKELGLENLDYID
jgi:hypothetical protein|tara:strand:+ start:1031 stop:1300 length:270 start_codon:yes stop_codon:yes gene_type:complete